MYMRVLDLRPEYAACDTNNTTQLRALARVVALRISKLERLPGAGDVPYLNAHSLALMRDFERLAKDKSLTVADFNVQMAELYNWAGAPVGKFGTNRACQIILQDGDV
jgi:hypothetical protein